MKTMSLNSRREYLVVKQREYLRVSRQERSAILDEMVKTTGMNRKYLIKLMGGDLRRKRRQRERGRTYGDEVEAAVLAVAECLDFICGKRLCSALLSTARNSERHGKIVVNPVFWTLLWRSSEGIFRPLPVGGLEFRRCQVTQG